MRAGPSLGPTEIEWSEPEMYQYAGAGTGPSLRGWGGAAPGSNGQAVEQLMQHSAGTSDGVVSHW
jgi:hypothetical protein